MTAERSGPILTSMMNGWQQKGSFVLRFKPETDVNEGRFHGRIEHVASGQTIRFDSVEDLLTFLYRILREVRVEFEQADTAAVELSDVFLRQK